MTRTSAINQITNSYVIDDALNDCDDAGKYCVDREDDIIEFDWIHSLGMFLKVQALKQKKKMNFFNEIYDFIDLIAFTSQYLMKCPKLYVVKKEKHSLTFRKKDTENTEKR
jgi:hypothetical protein